VERFEAEGKNIVPQAIAEELGCEKKYTWVVAQLKKMGLEQTEDIDSASLMPISRRKPVHLTWTMSLQRT
jgi:hypothetical protein